MKNGLVPEQRVDVNGKLTTRWVKAGADGKSMPRGIPAPKSSSVKEIATRVCMMLHPEAQHYDDFPDKAYAVRMDGDATFYSPDFAQQTIERIPARTLKTLENTLNSLPDAKAKRIVAQCVYDLIREMYDMGGTAAAPLVLKEQARLVSNACVFSGMTDAISRVQDHSASDYTFLLAQSLQGYENDGSHPHNPTNSEIDYSSVPTAKREQAENYVMADQLHRHFGNPMNRTPEGAIELVADYRGRWTRLAEVARDRGFKNPDSIRVVMDSETTALSEGAL